jgi:hypothetical protein
MLLGWPDVEIVGITTNLDAGGCRAGCVAYCLSPRSVAPGCHCLVSARRSLSGHPALRAAARNLRSATARRRQRQHPHSAPPTQHQPRVAALSRRHRLNRSNPGHVTLLNELGRHSHYRSAATIRVEHASSPRSFTSWSTSPHTSNFRTGSCAERRRRSARLLASPRRTSECRPRREWQAARPASRSAPRPRAASPVNGAS